EAIERRPILQILFVPGNESRIFLQRPAAIDGRDQPGEMERAPPNTGSVTRAQILDPARRQIGPGAVEIVPEFERRHRLADSPASLVRNRSMSTTTRSWKPFKSRLAPYRAATAKRTFRPSMATTSALASMVAFAGAGARWAT